MPDITKRQYLKMVGERNQARGKIEQALAVLNECLDNHTMSPYDVCCCGADKAHDILAGKKT